VIARYALWLLALVLGAGVSGQDAPAAESPAPRALVLMIADGFGPASLTLARSAAPRSLHLDGLLVGSVATLAADSLITDSAASATSLASGVATNNMVVGLDVGGNPAENLLERAHERGLRTGIVTTTTLTHATPACFSAHVEHRLQEAQIAEQQVASDVDLLLGGGRAAFLPPDGVHTPRRVDGRDLTAEARELGWTVALDRAELAAADTLPLLGLFSEGHLAYRIDEAAAAQPTLAEMTTKALSMLAEDDQPFVLVVEGGRIDHAGHANDAAAHLREIMAYDEAVGVVLDYLEEHPDVLLVSVSDHETGGLSLGRDYETVSAANWKPAVLRRATVSFEAMKARIVAGEDALTELVEGSGVDPTPAEAEALRRAVGIDDVIQRDRQLLLALAAPVTREAGISWSTLGHTAVDVPLFARGPGAGRLVGHHTHVELGRLLREITGLGFGADPASER